jgi:predicted esterase
MSRFSILVLWAVAIATFSNTALTVAQDFTPIPGTVIKAVRCADKPSIGYALYLPSSYTAESDWPLLIVLDPRGNALQAIELFRAAAEKQGFIVASSWDSASDTGGDETQQAVRAIWVDAHDRFHVAEGRVYAAGLSGTTRMAVLMAQAAPGSIAGVFGAAAGYPFDEEPGDNEQFAFYGTVGRTDFNYQEMVRLETALKNAGRTSRLERFDGGHSWPPAELVQRGLAWFNLIAIRDGLLPSGKEAAEAVEDFWKEDQYRAEEAWTAGDPSMAADLYRSMLIDYQGIQDEQGLANCTSWLKEILSSPCYRRQRKLLTSLADKEVTRIEEAKQLVMQAIRTGRPATAQALVIALKIEKLKTTAKNDPDPERRASAGRVLSELFVQAAYYLPRDYGGPGKERVMLTVVGLADAIRPGTPSVRRQLDALSEQANRP